MSRMHHKGVVASLLFVMAHDAGRRGKSRKEGPLAPLGTGCPRPAVLATK